MLMIFHPGSYWTHTCFNKGWPWPRPCSWQNHSQWPQLPLSANYSNQHSHNTCSHTTVTWVTSCIIPPTTSNWTTSLQLLHKQLSVLPQPKLPSGHNENVGNSNDVEVEKFNKIQTKTNNDINKANGTKLMVWRAESNDTRPISTRTWSLAWTFLGYSQEDKWLTV